MLQGLFAHRLTYCPWTNSRCTWRDREAGVDCGRPLACRRLAGPGAVGAPGSSRLLPIPAAPSGGNPLATATITSHDQCAEGPQGSGRDSGLDAGGATPHNPRLPLPDATTTASTSGATLSRASRPARSRSGAGASAGRSKRRRVRAVSARLETVQKVITDRSAARV